MAVIGKTDEKFKNSIGPYRMKVYSTLPIFTGISLLVGRIKRSAFECAGRYRCVGTIRQSLVVYNNKNGNTALGQYVVSSCG